jgi:L-asparaginase / beta-aspartyl-peptidase
LQVFVHGGVSGVAKHPLPSLAHSVRAGAGAARALDAFEAAVRALEEDPLLNAGVGSVANLAGVLELDAGIADGASGRCGGVAAVAVRHPVTLARRVLEETPHVLVVGHGAMALASDMEPVGPPTPREADAWERARAEGRLDPDHFGRADEVETVGAVALDDAGRLAAASSTGGVRGKMPGRVGDSPVFGAGLYASGAAAAVGTGVGELFLEALACFRVGRLIEEGADPQGACEEVIALLGARSEVAAGILALDARGRVGAAFGGGSWAVEGPGGALAAVPVA